LGTPFDVALLLNSTNAKVIARSASAVRIAVVPDKSLVREKTYGIRCAASIKATITLDPVSFFPVRIEGEVVESGCNGEFQPVIHYETWTRRPMLSQFRKGATFNVEYALQKDKFADPAKSFWISSAQHYSQPWDSDNQVLYYWGRQVIVKSSGGHRLVKDIKTTAQEFGAASLLRFDR
jgi:hypothetical protein